LDNIGSSEVGRVSRVWFDKSKGEQRASVLVTDKQLLDILRLNDRTEIGFSPYYDADLDIVDGKITQRNRYYNNLSLLFLTVPRGEKSYVFMDSQNKVGSNMTIEELKAQIAAVVANVDAFASSQKGNADSQDDPANTGDRYAAGYEEGLKAGIEHGEALAYADSLSIAVLPTDNLSQILEKVATKITGKVVKAGETPAFYKGMITGNINVFEDSARQNPRKKVQDKSSPAAIAQAAHEKAINARYAPKETAKT
jgi:hypothetical protein